MPHQLNKKQLQFGLGGLLLSPLLPLVFLQGKQLLRHFEQNPVVPPVGETEGACGNGDAELNLLVIGESTVEGIGVDQFEDSLSAKLAEEISRIGDLCVRWKAVGKSGATASFTLKEQLPAVKDLHKYQVVVLVLGANDSFALTSPAKWARQIETIARHIHKQQPDALIYLASLPPVGKFPALPQPTRWVLGKCNEMLCAASSLVAQTYKRITYSKALFNDQEHLLCKDGIHPSAAGYALWAQAIAEELLPKLAGIIKQHKSSEASI